MPYKNVMRGVLLALLFAQAAVAGAEDNKAQRIVFERNKNIFIMVESTTTQLTDTGVDYSPLLSPDGQWVIFSRTHPDRGIRDCEENRKSKCDVEQLGIIHLANQNQLTIIDPSKKDLLAKSELPYIGEFENKTFSADSQSVYFLATSFHDSNEILGFDIKGMKMRRITKGVSFRVIKSVAEKSPNTKHWGGNLLVKKVKPHGEARFDYEYWVVSPEGKKLKLVGTNNEDFTRKLGLVYMESGSLYPAGAGTTYEESGNIHLQREDRFEQLTQSGTDYEPVLSPDGKWVAFSRKVELQGDCRRQACTRKELWLFDLETRSERKLLSKLDTKDLEAEFKNKAFSPDGKTLYFETPNSWPTPSAILAVDIDGQNEHVIVEGSDFRVIRETKILWRNKANANDIIVKQRRNFIGAGTYDWYWLVSPQGQYLGDLGWSMYLGNFTKTVGAQYMENASPFKNKFGF